ncbi:MAG: PEP-CTERM/exosortase system-associated acyltransferase [Polaromonas sp.]
MKPHRLETADCRTGIPGHRARNPVAPRLMKQPVYSAHPNQHARHGLDHAHRSALELRYQVYCHECGFLSPDDYPDGVETDEHDENAAHFYTHDSHQELVGYVRLVRPDADQRFPFQKHCSMPAGDVTLPLPGHAAEISRLIIRNDYRRLRHKNLADTLTGQNSSAIFGEKRGEAQQVILDLYRQMYAYSRANGIGHWYSAMERTLARSLQRFNITFRSIGPQTDYYGPVAPYLANLQELEVQVGARDPALLSWFQQPGRHSAIATTGEEPWSLSHIGHPNGLAYTL